MVNGSGAGQPVQLDAHHVHVHDDRLLEPGMGRGHVALIAPRASRLASRCSLLAARSSLLGARSSLLGARSSLLAFRVFRERLPAPDQFQPEVRRKRPSHEQEKRGARSDRLDRVPVRAIDFAQSTGLRPFPCVTQLFGGAWMWHHSSSRTRGLGNCPPAPRGPRL